MKNCEQIQKLLPEYLRENLDAEKKAQIQNHLQTCGSCRMEFEVIGNLWSKMELIPDEKPGVNLKTNFYTMLSAYKKGLTQTNSKIKIIDKFSVWLDRWWPRKPAFQFGVAVLFLAFGFILGRWVFSADQTNGEIAQLREELKHVNQMVTLSLLRQQSPSERLKGVSWINQLSQPDPEIITALVHTLNKDSNVNVRLAAVDALSLFIDKPDVKDELIQSLLKQNYPFVQIELIDVLVKTKVKKSIDVFEELVEKQGINQTVREHARWGIQQIG